MAQITTEDATKRAQAAGYDKPVLGYGGVAQSLDDPNLRKQFGDKTGMRIDPYGRTFDDWATSSNQAPAPGTPSMDSLTAPATTSTAPPMGGDHVETAVPAPGATVPTGQSGQPPVAAPIGTSAPLPAKTGYRAPGAPAATQPGEAGPQHKDPYTEQPGSTIGETRGTSWGGGEQWNGSEWLPMSASGGSGGATLTGDHTETPVAPGGSPAPGGPAAPAVDPQAAKDAAFARAKDKIGLDTRASMTALRENLAGRGTLGGGLEGGGMASLLGGGEGALTDVVSNQTAYDVAGNNALADRTYQGGLVQRGQNLGLSQSLLSLLGGAY